jgi:uroporphyrinogen decarboxylase
MAPARRPDFNRLLTTLRCGTPDAIPLIELGIHPTIKEAILGRPIVTVADDAEFMRTMGYDFVKIQPGITFMMDQPVSLGSLTALERAWAPEGKGRIQTWEDFERYPWPSPTDISYARLEEARHGLPDEMGVIGQYGDIFTVAWELMGFEVFAQASFEQPALVEAVLDKVGGLITSMFETMATMDWVGALWFSDDIAFASGLLMSPDFLRSQFFPLLRRIGDCSARRGVPLIYHSDGLLWEVMDDIIGSGVSALHPIEPKAMDIVEVKRRYGKQLSLCGGIDVDLLSRGTTEQVRELVHTLIAGVGPGGGWCAGSSNSVPEYVPVANYLTMVETVLEEGKY